MRVNRETSPLKAHLPFFIFDQIDRSDYDMPRVRVHSLVPYSGCLVRPWFNSALLCETLTLPCSVFNR